MDTQALREYDAACRLRFDVFFQRCFLTLNPGQEFKENWSIDAMGHFATRFIDGEFRRGIVNMPPRHGKSQMFNVALSAFILGHDPRKRIFCIGYADLLASDHATMFKDIVESSWYQRLLPKMQIKRAIDNDIYTTMRGYRRWASVGGTIVGMGGDVVILDDPIKTSDVRSPVLRGKVNDWQQPASRDAQVGEVLNPARESRETIEQLKIENGPIVFAAQQQQDAVPEGGAMLPTSLYQFYAKLPERDPESFAIQSWDCATKMGSMNSFSVCTTWLLHHRCFYLMHVLRKHMPFPELVDAAEMLEGQFKPRYILIEDASSGTG